MISNWWCIRRPPAAAGPTQGMFRILRGSQGRRTACRGHLRPAGLRPWYCPAGSAYRLGGHAATECPNHGGSVVCSCARSRRRKLPWANDTRDDVHVDSHRGWGGWLVVACRAGTRRVGVMAGGGQGPGGSVEQHASNFFSHDQAVRGFTAWFRRCRGGPSQPSQPVSAKVTLPENHSPRCTGVYLDPRSRKKSGCARRALQDSFTAVSNDAQHAT